MILRLPSFSYGIYTDSASALTVTDSVITGYSGIRAYGTVTVSGNTKITGTSTDGYGIYVYKDCELIVGDDAVIEGANAGIYSYGGKVTVNGGTISATRETCYTTYPFGIYSKNYSATRAALVINGGTISGVNAGVYVTGTDLTITAGTISGTGLNDGGKSGYGTGVYAAGQTADTAVTAWISGGTISGLVNCLRISKGSQCTLTVSAGTYSGNINIDSGTLNISGGTYNAAFKVSSSGVLAITGGSFSADPTGYVDDTAYTVTQQDSMYTVTAKQE